MSALAKFLFVSGYKVSGSDAIKNEETENLALYGVKVFTGVDEAREELLRADAVIYTDAIPAYHLEYKRAWELKKPMFSRGDLLEMLCHQFPNVLAVSGSHGKTTCTSMCAHILKSVNVPFTAHIGGEDSEFGNFFASGEEYLLTEACEYKKNFLKVHATSAVILNIDLDHMECYGDETELLKSFKNFALSTGTTFVCADDKRCLQLGDFPSFGIKNSLSDYRAVDIRDNGERYSFTVEEYGKALCRVRLKAIGYCNIYNALAGFALMRSFGFHEQEIVKGLESFTSVKRRFEKIGAYKGVSFICDYAHHPKEIQATVFTAEKVCKGNLYVVFQPHTYSRTKLLMSEFVEVLRPIKNLMVYKTYPAREKYDGEGSGERLVQMIGNCLYAENVYVLKMWIKKTVKEGDVVLFLGAGDVYYAAQFLLKELR